MKTTRHSSGKLNNDWGKAKVLDVFLLFVFGTGSHIAQAVLVLAEQSDSSELSAPISQMLG